MIGSFERGGPTGPFIQYNDGSVFLGFMQNGKLEGCGVSKVGNGFISRRYENDRPIVINGREVPCEDVSDIIRP